MKSRIFIFAYPRAFLVWRSCPYLKGRKGYTGSLRRANNSKASFRYYNARRVQRNLGVLTPMENA